MSQDIVPAMSWDFFYVRGVDVSGDRSGDVSGDRSGDVRVFFWYVRVGSRVYSAMICAVFGWRMRTWGPLAKAMTRWPLWLVPMPRWRRRPA